MCNDYRLEVDVASIAEDFDDLKIKITMPEGTPNVPAREDIKISDTAPVVRSVEGARGIGELVKVKHFAAITKPSAVGALLQAIDGYSGHKVTVMPCGCHRMCCCAPAN